MTSYVGERTIDGIVVERDGVALDPGLEEARYSEIGFDWGFVGPPSRQLSFALLMDHLGDGERARKLVELFTIHIAANLDNEWELDSADLKAIVRKLETT